MRLPLIVALLFVLAQAAHAVGNVVEGDMEVLRKAGFRFEKSEYGSAGKTLRFTVQIPPSQDFGVLGVKPFVAAAFIKPEDEEAKGPRLIGSRGTRLPLAHSSEDEGHSLTLSVSTVDSEGTYLEFSFNQGSGHATMLIHVPLKAVIEFLEQSPKAEPPAAAEETKPE